MTRPIFAIVPFEHAHLALLPLRSEQVGELERFGQVAGEAADRGPAFSAVEQDADGRIERVLACAGLIETRPLDDPRGGYATAWAAFAEGLRAAQWSPLTAAIKGVLNGAGYARVDMLVNANWPAARRYAEALGFKLESMIYARATAGGEG